MNNQETKMTDEPMTLREKIARDMDARMYDGQPSGMILDAIATILEDTGAPAHMRVAKELRGEE